MSNGGPLSLAELDRRIAIVRDNIRQLIEQAAAVSGAEDEDRNAERIAHQQEELERLTQERDALLRTTMWKAQPQTEAKANATKPRAKTKTKTKPKAKAKAKAKAKTKPKAKAKTKAKKTRTKKAKAKAKKKK